MDRRQLSQMWHQVTCGCGLIYRGLWSINRTTKLPHLEARALALYIPVSARHQHAQNI